jgi:hypothetical protein
MGKIIGKNDHVLNWTEKEAEELTRRILNLRDDQIAALLNLAGLNFSISDIEAVTADIRENGSQSGHLPILISEAQSKKILLWWLNYFEKTNFEKQAKEAG